MAQRDNLRKRIVNYLEQCPDKTCSLKDIVSASGTDRKCINQILYALKRSNTVKQVQSQPPIWKLLNRDLALKARIWAQNTKGKPWISSPKRNKNRNQTDDPLLQQRIVQCLQNHSMPVKTIDIARAVGFRTSKEINPMLYRMEKSRILIKCDDSEGIVKWILNSEGGGFQQTAPLDDPGIVGYAVSTRNEPQECTGDTEQEADWTASSGTDSYVKDEMDVNMEDISPVYQSTPVVSSPDDNSSVVGGDTVESPCGDDIGGSDDKKIDQVLKALFVNMKCPGASFIIAKKCYMDKMETESYLQKCADLEYVSISRAGSDNIYELTEKGKEYITRKLGKIDTVKSDTVQQIRAPPRTIHKEFMGPPPEPARLVVNPGSKFFNPLHMRLGTPNEQTATKGSGAELLSGRKDNGGDGNVPKQLMSSNASPVNRPPFAGFPSNPGTSYSTIPLSSNLGNITFNFQSTGSPNRFGLGRGRGVRNTSSDFVRPRVPVEIISRQLNQTDISSTPEKDSFSTSYVNRGLQKLLAQPTSFPSPTHLTMQSSGSSGPQSLGLPTRARVFSEEMDQQPRSLPVRMENPFLPTSLDLNSESFAALNKNPVSALMEYAQSRHQEAEIRVTSQSGPSHKPKFVMGVFIGGKQIAEVTCSNKKDGRKEVADKALRSLIASGDYKASSAAAASKPVVPLDKMTHFDKMAALVHKSFNELSATISENFSGRKVIAGLVMKMADVDIGTVISIGTGNRCITGPQLSLEGNTVNDSHAEIITRRGFIRFMYKQLKTYRPGTHHRLFESSRTGKLRLKDNITFHLYISTAPCGDGALFSPRDEASNNATLSSINDRTHNPTFTSAAQGLVRTKMEGGEGTIPVEDDFTVQTFDGIQRGERLRTMSCTDKLCRWNVVGMQGALLSHILDPVYLDSLTLGLLYDHGHLSRAMCCRLTRGDTDINNILPSPYHLNHPWLGRVTVCDVPRETQKTKALSLNWCYGDTEPEVTDGTLGLCCTSIEKTMFSRCSKKNLYDSFKQVCVDFNRKDLLNFPTYGKAKMAAEDFQKAKKALIQKFTENGYGTWVSKPPEEEMFA